MNRIFLRIGIVGWEQVLSCKLAGNENGFREDSKRKYEILQCKLIKQNTHAHTSKHVSVKHESLQENGTVPKVTEDED